MADGREMMMSKKIANVWVKALLGFVVFGGLIFEVISRIFFR